MLSIYRVFNGAVLLRGFALGSAALLLSGCSDLLGSDPVDPGPPQVARATLLDAKGVKIGEAILAQGNGELLLDLTAMALKPGAYQGTIHEAGQCDAPDFAAAGEPWQADTPPLAQLIAGPDGKANLTARMAGGSIAGQADSLLDSDGAAFTLTDGKGARVACGVFRAYQPLPVER